MKRVRRGELPQGTPAPLTAGVAMASASSITLNDDGAGAVGVRVLREVVGARELLAVVAALKGLVLRV